MTIQLNRKFKEIMPLDTVLIYFNLAGEINLYKYKFPRRDHDKAVDKIIKYKNGDLIWMKKLK